MKILLSSKEQYALGEVYEDAFNNIVKQFSKECTSNKHIASKNANRLYLDIASLLNKVELDDTNARFFLELLDAINDLIILDNEKQEDCLIKITA